MLSPGHVMEGRKPMALWLELEQQLPTLLSSEGEEERKRAQLEAVETESCMQWLRSWC